MNINRKLIVGLLLVMVGVGIVDFTFIKHIERSKALPNQLFGFAIVAVGAYFVFQGKKQQKEEKENENN